MTAKDLKNALLQEAVQGKLVPQIASEGNARDLLEEIRKERLSHGFANSRWKLDAANNGICDGKNKKTKKSDLRSKSQIRVTKKELPEITEDEIPFEIPENWCWCRLGEIVYNNGQKTPDKEFSYIDIGSIDNLHQKLNDKENFVSPEQAPSRARKIVKKGDIIYATVRPYLHNMCIIDKDFEKEPIASTGFAVLACYPQILNKYLFYYLLSPSFDNYANDTENAKGVAYPAINDEKLYKGVIPLPPLAEQKRIVDAIEKFMPLIEEYGKKESALKAINEQIGALTKKAILQEAVQGKLVPQIASEGNARDLLEEIRKERLSHGFANSYGICDGKNKKSKSSDLRSKSPQRNAPASVVRVTKKELSEITEDEIPFEIPENWCWCRLGDLGITNTGTTPSKFEGKYFGNYIDFLSPGDLDGSIVTYGNQGLSEEGYKVARPTPKGTIIQVCIGGSIGKCAIVDREVTFNQQINSITPIKIKSDYIFYTISSDFFYKNIRESATGTATPIINKSNWERLLIPLPPLAEQKRIVEAIEKMLPLCEKLGE